MRKKEPILHISILTDGSFIKEVKLKAAEKIMQEIISSGETPDAEWYEHYGYILKRKESVKRQLKIGILHLKLDSTKSNLIKEIENCKSKR